MTAPLRAPPARLPSTRVRAWDRWRAPVFISGSAAAHGLLVLALVLPWPGARPFAPPPMPDRTGAVEVVMVEQPAAPDGAVQAQAAPTPPPDEGVAPPQPPAPPAVNLGGAPVDPWSVRSDTLKPPAPDARFRNLPPRYPAEAAMRGESGTVELLIHVGGDGTAAGADIVNSSGSAALDREARRAVLLWHFAPAQVDGQPIPFDYPISIHFTRTP